jgi:long-subunit acyl-CoA synthetase (AMP-forming)
MFTSGTVADDEDVCVLTDGRPTPGCVARIVDAAGRPLAVGCEGEIEAFGPQLCLGYVDASLDADAFTADGFLRTGDRGEVDGEGRLKITGRVKELFKTAKGKYVAPAPIENRLNAHAMVELSLVSGVGQAEAYALVVPAEGVRARLDDEAVRTQVQREMEQLLRDVNRELSDYERLHMIVVVREPWSIENGFLTPTMKIKRARIEAAVAPQVEGWYAGRDRVQWA